MPKQMLLWTIAATAYVALPASAQELPTTHLKALVPETTTPMAQALEIPYWSETVPQASGGQVTADIVAIDQLGIDDKAVLRLLKLGMFDVASTAISKMAGDDPHFEGCDLAGISLDIEAARAACDAYRPVLDRLLQENWNAKLLTIVTSPPQVIWCKPEIAGLADLEGKKVRVFNKSMTEFLEGVGAEPVTINFAEVVPALERGVVDCAVTGSLTGNTAGWPEVTDYIYPLYMGWAIIVHVANLDSWNRLDPSVQTFLLEQHAAFEDKYWETMRQAIVEADNCNFGKASCEVGKPADMTLVPVTEQDQALRKQIIEDVVLKDWVARAGADAAGAWNETVGQVVGMRDSRSRPRRGLHADDPDGLPDPARLGRTSDRDQLARAAAQPARSGAAARHLRHRDRLDLRRLGDADRVGGTRGGRRAGPRGVPPAPDPAAAAAGDRGHDDHDGDDYGHPDRRLLPQFRHRCARADGPGQPVRHRAWPARNSLGIEVSVRTP
jgi:TRAP-type C4-dicarboxylate transport system substrate-binding protein